jgi:aerobic C4-dicarboxylate transport protein
MQPCGDAFIKLGRMIIAPIVFVTVVVGIATLTNAKEVGRSRIKAILYFEVMTTQAMFIGLIVAHVIKAGAGLINPLRSMTRRPQLTSTRGTRMWRRSC